VTVLTPGTTWQIGCPGQPLLYDLRRVVDTIETFHYPVPKFSPNNFYLDTRTYATDHMPGQPTLHAQRLGALMPLRDPASSSIVYLDVAVENKGFIYVLSYVRPGDQPADYRLDIYSPDGSPLQPDVNSHNGEISAARMIVDQWRTLFTLNYEQMQGVAGRPEPTVSQWIPSTDGLSPS
jgi:hypothetical protein